MKNLFIFASVYLLATTCFAEEEKAIVYQPMNSGVEIIFRSDGSDWLKIQSIGEADLNIGDRTDIRQATKKATLRAKADISKFMNERITSEETSEEITKLSQTATADGNSISKKSTRKIVDTTIEKIVNQSSAILKGVLPLETKVNGEEKYVRVVVGVSRSSIGIANSLSDSFKANSSSRTNSPVSVERSDGDVIRRSKNYDKY